MSTVLEHFTIPFDDLEVADVDYFGYHHPVEIVGDPLLTIARKRALLAHWCSDIHAVAGQPSLRRSPAGVTTTIDELQKALGKLDEMVDAIALAGANPPMHA